MTNAVITAQQGSTQANMAFKNRIINGDMRIDQRNNGASTTPVSGVIYNLDRWHLNLAQSSKVSIQRNAGNVTPPAGFTNYAGLTSLSSYTPLSTDYHTFRQNIEGFNVADLAWGTSAAKAITISFWIRSNLTGTFGGCVNNGPFSRGYPYTYTIGSANTWEYKTVTIPGDTGGTWATDNTASLLIGWTLGTGSTYNTGVTNAWNGVTGGGYAPLAAAGVTNILSTNGATLYITGVQVEVGSAATGFDYRNYGIELAMCQRYYFQGASPSTYYRASTNSTSATPVSVPFPTEMRVVPTLTVTSFANNDIAANGGSNLVNKNSVTFRLYSTTGGYDYAYGVWTFNVSAEL